MRAKGLIAELTPPHAQSAWRFMEERVWFVKLTVYCNYLFKKKKKIGAYVNPLLISTNWFINHNLGLQCDVLWLVRESRKKVFLFSKKTLS